MEEGEILFTETVRMRTYSGDIIEMNSRVPKTLSKWHDSRMIDELFAPHEPGDIFIPLGNIDYRKDVEMRYTSRTFVRESFDARAIANISREGGYRSVQISPLVVRYWPEMFVVATTYIGTRGAQIYIGERVYPDSPDGIAMLIEDTTEGLFKDDYNAQGEGLINLGCTVIAPCGNDCQSHFDIEATDTHANMERMLFGEYGITK